MMAGDPAAAITSAVEMLGSALRCTLDLIGGGDIISTKWDSNEDTSTAKETRDTAKQAESARPPGCQTSSEDESDSEPPPVSKLVELFRWLHSGLVPTYCEFVAVYCAYAKVAEQAFSRSFALFFEVVRQLVTSENEGLAIAASQLLMRPLYPLLQLGSQVNDVRESHHGKGLQHQSAGKNSGTTGSPIGGGSRDMSSEQSDRNTTTICAAGNVSFVEHAVSVACISGVQGISYRSCAALRAVAASAEAVGDSTGWTVVRQALAQQATLVRQSARHEKSGDTACRFLMFVRNLRACAPRQEVLENPVLCFGQSTSAHQWGSGKDAFAVIEDVFVGALAFVVDDAHAKGAILDVNTKQRAGLVAAELVVAIFKRTAQSLVSPDVCQLDLEFAVQLLAQLGSAHGPSSKDILSKLGSLVERPGRHHQVDDEPSTLERLLQGQVLKLLLQVSKLCRLVATALNKGPPAMDRKTIEEQRRTVLEPAVGAIAEALGLVTPGLRLLCCAFGQNHSAGADGEGGAVGSIAHEGDNLQLARVVKLVVSSFELAQTLDAGSYNGEPVGTAPTGGAGGGAGAGAGAVSVTVPARGKSFFSTAWKFFAATMQAWSSATDGSRTAYGKSHSRRDSIERLPHSVLSALMQRSDTALASFLLRVLVVWLDCAKPACGIEIDVQKNTLSAGEKAPGGAKSSSQRTVDGVQQLKHRLRNLQPKHARPAPEPSFLSKLSCLFHPHRLFVTLLQLLDFDASLALDFLISNETCFLEYFLRYFKAASVFQADVASTVDRKSAVQLPPQFEWDLRQYYLLQQEVAFDGGAGQDTDCDVPHEQDSADMAASVVATLAELDISISSLQAKNLYPYNPAALLRWLRQFRGLVERVAASASTET